MTVMKVFFFNLYRIYLFSAHAHSRFCSVFPSFQVFDEKKMEQKLVRKKPLLPNLLLHPIEWDPVNLSLCMTVEDELECSKHGFFEGTTAPWFDIIKT